MKVLVVTNDFPPKVGGVNYYVAHLARRLPEGEATVFASAWPGSERFDAAFPQHVVRWSSHSMYPTPAVLDRIVDLVRAERADIVLFGAAAPLALLGPSIRRRTGIPYAAFTHGVEIWAAQVPLTRGLLRRVAGEAALLTCVSQWTIDRLRDVVGHRPPIELLPPGIDAALFNPGVSDAEVRDRHGFGDDAVIGCVSRLTLRKGQDVIIRAMPGILAEFPRTWFLVVGDGPDRGRLERLARRLAVDDRLVFAGEVAYEQLPAHFRAGDVFAMPCRSRKWGLEVEALGAVFYQAAAVGRPCVGGDSGGAPEAVRHQESGLVVDGNHPELVGRAILSLLREPDRAAAMGARGAAWVHHELTWDAMAGRLRGLLSGALASATL
jgi:phosphatidyl-myo-inositol dimannoside synthase